MNVTIVTRYSRLETLKLTRAPGRRRLPPGEARLHRRLTTPAAGCCARDARSYYRYCPSRRALASFASVAPGTRASPWQPAWSRSTLFLALRRVGLLLEHLEHAVGHDEAADDVRGAEHDGEEAHDPHERPLVTDAEHEHRADDDDPVDRVRARHQRRVQQCRHLRDHLEAEKDGEHEDRHLEDQQGVVTHAGAASFLPATHAPAVISSDQSRLSWPWGARCSSSACTLRE